MRSENLKEWQYVNRFLGNRKLCWLCFQPTKCLRWTGLVQIDSRVGWLRGLIDEKKAYTIHPHVWPTTGFLNKTKVKKGRQKFNWIVVNCLVYGFKGNVGRRLVDFFPQLALCFKVHNCFQTVKICTKQQMNKANIPINLITTKRNEFPSTWFSDHVKWYNQWCENVFNPQLFSINHFLKQVFR